MFILVVMGICSIVTTHASINLDKNNLLINSAFNDKYQDKPIDEPRFSDQVKDSVNYSLDIEIKQGLSLGITALVTNNDEEPITEELPCTLSITANIIFVGNMSTQLTPQPVPPPNAVYSVIFDPVFGFGFSDVTVAIFDPFEPTIKIAEAQSDGLMFGPLVYIY